MAEHGLYVDSLIYEIEYQDIKFDENYRKQLEEKADKEGLENLYNMAKKIDEEAVKKISPNDKKRILRILEIYHATGKNKTWQEQESRKNPVEYDYKVFAINWDREKLYERINKRVDIMLENGLIEEVKQIKEKYKKFPTAMQGLGYKEILEYLDGECTLEEAVYKLKRDTRHFAKRQITWFKRERDVIWVDKDAFEYDEEKILQYMLAVLQERHVWNH